MAVVLVGVGADSGNITPVPKLGENGRFEFLPIPEKAPATTETRTLGSMSQRYGDGPLAELVDGIRPNSDEDWIRDEKRVRTHPVHYDPNLEALTYGEGGKDQNVNAIEEHLGEGDILAFYTGLETAGRMHRYVFGYFTLAEDPIIINPDTDEEKKETILENHPENGHTKRFKDNGELYALDPEMSQGASRVAIVDGRKPGRLLDRAVRLSGPADTGNYYMKDSIEETLNPNTAYLGGFKPPIRCDISAADFVEFVESQQ
ncbi:hypothetical protein ACFQJ7_14355 [Halovenus rubra]|uniref:Nucleotide modification associated domain-containing protein n=2 Tax=Halovenus rubra TaxID=869890 RepID=A0ABD5XFQ5_9EURY|nr:hypothetical protein [Halovenus rubra]